MNRILIFCRLLYSEHKFCRFAMEFGWYFISSFKIFHKLFCYGIYHNTVVKCLVIWAVLELPHQITFSEKKITKLKGQYIFSYICIKKKLSTKDEKTWLWIFNRFYIFWNALNDLSHINDAKNNLNRITTNSTLISSFFIRLN